MGRFAPKYSKEQRAAVVKVIIDDDIWPSTVVELAAKGELEGLAPFDLNISSARDMAGKERRRRRGVNLGPLARGELREAGDQLLRRLVDLQTQDVERLEMGNRYGRFSRSAFRDAARNQRELDAMLRPKERVGKSSPEAAPKPAALLDRLAAKERRAESDKEGAKRKAVARSKASSSNGTDDSEQGRDHAVIPGESNAQQHEVRQDSGATGPVPMPTSEPPTHDQGSGI